MLVCMLALSCHSQGEENTVQAVDLGLPSGTKWADRNVGAEYPDRNGDYSAWGEIDVKDKYTWDNYKHCKSFDEITKYNNDDYSPHFDGNLTLELEDDAACQLLGEGWAIPTFEQCDELMKCCEWTWVATEGFFGYEVTGPNGNYILLPAAGMRFDEEEGDEEFHPEGYYWLSHLDSQYPGYACDLHISQEGVHRNTEVRAMGASIRPVAR